MKFIPKIARDQRHDARDMINRVGTHLAVSEHRRISSGARFKIGAARGALGQHRFGQILLCERARHLFRRAVKQRQFGFDGDALTPLMERDIKCLIGAPHLKEEA